VTSPMTNFKRAVGLDYTLDQGIFSNQKSKFG
jgi:hypothetical protein